MKLAAKTEPNKEKMQTIWDAGFRYLEIYTTVQNINKDSEDLLNSFEFEYAIHAPIYSFDESVIDFAHHVGARIINTHKILNPDRFRELVQYARGKNITITIENDSLPSAHQIKDGQLIVMPPEPFHAASDGERIVRDILGVKLCLDIEHAWLRGEYSQILTAHASHHIRHVHLTGYISSNSKGFHRPVYESDFLVENTIHYLARESYEGFVVCEHNVQYHTFEIWKRSFDFCNDIIVEKEMLNRTKLARRTK